jgi:hypothetical protein
MTEALVKCSVSDTKSMASDIKALYTLGSSLTTADATSFIYDNTEAIECLVGETTSMAGGYFDAISL